jgi:hypothetical protein
MKIAMIDGGLHHSSVIETLGRDIVSVPVTNFL